MTPAQREIIAEVAQRHKVTVESLTSKARHHRIAHPRQEAMYLLRAEGRWSLPQIGRVLGGRDHSTVVHGIAAYLRRAGLSTASIHSSSACVHNGNGMSQSRLSTDGGRLPS